MSHVWCSLIIIDLHPACEPSINHSDPKPELSWSDSTPNYIDNLLTYFAACLMVLLLTLTHFSHCSGTISNSIIAYNIQQRLELWNSSGKPCEKSKGQQIASSCFSRVFLEEQFKTTDFFISKVFHGDLLDFTCCNRKVWDWHLNESLWYWPKLGARFKPRAFGSVFSNFIIAQMIDERDQHGCGHLGWIGMNAMSV